MALSEQFHFSNHGDVIMIKETLEEMKDYLSDSLFPKPIFKKLDAVMEQGDEFIYCAGGFKIERIRKQVNLKK